MQIHSSVLKLDFNKVRMSSSWNLPLKAETKMHRIHMYPAKFPSFLVTKTIDHVREKGYEIKTIADIFCGCGTTALESKINGINFWGCDINPIATLIAKVKSEKYNARILEHYFGIIQKKYITIASKPTNPFSRDERIKYWFDEKQLSALYKLRTIIKEIPQGKYRNFFLVAFSNILKSTSRWLTKSIKPTIDPNKLPSDVWSAFIKQFNMMLIASIELKNNKLINEIKIQNVNFLSVDIKKSFVDLLITSPPYVTSYEYADLHQLSTLLLGYTKDYKTFRKGTIGSQYHDTIDKKGINKLNTIGKDIYDKLNKVSKSRARSAAKYFIDINNAFKKAYKIINPNGFIAIVIGNTSYKNVKVDNAKYAILCLQNLGFSNFEIYKRKISSKMLTPYRDKFGKFSNDKRKRKVYAYEFVIIGEKDNANN